MSQLEQFSVVNLQQQEIPLVIEDASSRHPYVPIGIISPDDFFENITEAFTNSTTTAACVNGIADLVFGKGLYVKNEQYKDTFNKMLPQEEIKRVAFDLKLYGNAAFQVNWNADHTQIVNMYHLPIQYLRARKLGKDIRIQAYYYCIDWTDQKHIRNKVEIPAFGTSFEQTEILYIKDYTPGKFYYSLPDWFAAIQFSFVEAELSNLHLNNIENGFLPLVMVNMNNGVPSPEERATIEDMIQGKFTGTRNAGRFILTFNDDKERQPTVDTIKVDDLHEKYKYVSEYAQDKLLVANRVTSPLLFGIRTQNNGFSSQSEEMETAYSIMQTMTILPLQNLLLNQIDAALEMGGWNNVELFFEQSTPLAILSATAEATDTTVEEVKDDIGEESENPNTTDVNTQADRDDSVEQHSSDFRMSNPRFKKEYEIVKQ